MSNTEFRVRPVIRHAVTEYSMVHGPSGTMGGCSKLVAEFPNEEMAEKVREALDFQVAPRAYLMVKRTFDLDTQAQHADSQAEADAFVAAKLVEGEEWRVFERVLTDPVAKALHSVRPVDSSDCFIGPNGRKMVEASRYFGRSHGAKVVPAGVYAGNSDQIDASPI